MVPQTQMFYLCGSVHLNDVYIYRRCSKCSNFTRCDRKRKLPIHLSYLFVTIISKPCSCPHVLMCPSTRLCSLQFSSRQIQPNTFYLRLKYLVSFLSLRERHSWLKVLTFEVPILMFVLGIIFFIFVLITVPPGDLIEGLTSYDSLVASRVVLLILMPLSATCGSSAFGNCCRTPGQRGVLPFISSFALSRWLSRVLCAILIPRSLNIIVII